MPVRINSSFKFNLQLFAAPRMSHGDRLAHIENVYARTVAERQGALPTLHELADLTGIGTCTLKSSLVDLRNRKGMDLALAGLAPVRPNAIYKGAGLESLVSGNGVPSTMATALGRLDAHSRHVMAAVFYSNPVGHHMVSYEMAGTLFEPALTRQRIQQIVDKAIGRLSAMSSGSPLKNYWDQIQRMRSVSGPMTFGQWHTHLSRSSSGLVLPAREGWLAADVEILARLFDGGAGRMKDGSRFIGNTILIDWPERSMVFHP